MILPWALSHRALASAASTGVSVLEASPRASASLIVWLESVCCKCETHIVNAEQSAKMLDYQSQSKKESKLCLKISHLAVP